MLPNIPPTKMPGQLTITPADAYLVRVPYQFSNPSTYSPQAWRRLVRSQMFAMACKDAIVSYLVSLDWKIVPRDSSMQDELSGTVKYYTKLLEKAGYGFDLDFIGHIELIMSDVLDLPFGGVAELGRKDSGRVAWIEPIDGGTCYPSYNADFPVVQQAYGKIVALPKENVVRTYMSPRPELERKGWGMAPPEKILYALELLSRGDSYYANLLLDIPPAGLLDLGDTERETALEWASSWKASLTEGNKSFQIPVLYEHTTEVKFIPLGKVPNDIMYDRITLRYGALVCAGYGLTLGDIGIQSTSSSGETLAGSIRSERKSRKNGYARAKAKIKFYFNQILPPSLEFKWIDTDDETNVAASRSMLAFATAASQLVDAKVVTNNELRAQAIQNGLFTISMPEEYPGGDVPEVTKPEQNITQNMLGNPTPPSAGGEGEIRKYNLKLNKSKFKDYVQSMIELSYEYLDDVYAGYTIDNAYIPKSIASKQISNSDLWNTLASKVPAPITVKDETGKQDREIHKYISSIVAKYVFLVMKDAYFDNDALEMVGDARYNMVVDSVLSTLSYDEIEKQLQEIL